jgi:hypothetical protein
MGKIRNNWDVIEVPLTRLHLDPKNKRLSAATDHSSSAELIKELIADHKVEDIMKSIKSRGYLKADPIVGFPHPDRENHLIIVEGNRRLAALKLLANPELAPPELKTKYRKIASGFEKAIFKKIRMMWISHREESESYIALRHTRGPAGIMDWPAHAQGLLYRDLLNDGLSVDEIAERFKKTPGDIRSTLKAHAFLRLYANIDLDENERKLLAPKKFPTTNFERLFNFKDAKEILGVDFMPNGEIKFSNSISEMAPFLKRLLVDAARQTGTRAFSRQIHDSKDARKYLQEDVADLLPTKKSGSFDTSKLDMPDKGPKPGKPKPNRPSAGRKKEDVIIKAAGVLDQGVPTIGLPPRIVDIIGELQSLPCEEFPNCAGVLLRTLMDTAMLEWIEHTGAEKAYRSGLGHKASGTKNLLDFIREKSGMIQVGSAAMKSAASLTMKDGVFSIDGLNGWAHNQHWPATEKEVRALWGKMKPLLVKLLERPV